MLLGKTVYSYCGSLIYGNASQGFVTLYLSCDVMFSWIHLPICMWALPCQCVFYNNDFTSLLKGRLGLLPTSCPLSASKMSPRPVCFSNWPLLMKPSVEFRPIQNCRSQMCQVILKPHKNTADITVQIAGNYDFSSQGKYTQISSYNWSLLKIKAVWGF